MSDEVEKPKDEVQPQPEEGVIDVDLDPEDDALLDALWDEEGHKEAAAGRPPLGYIKPVDSDKSTS